MLLLLLRITIYHGYSALLLLLLLPLPLLFTTGMVIRLLLVPGGIPILLAYCYLAEGGGINVGKGGVNVGKRGVYLLGPILNLNLSIYP